MRKTIAIIMSLILLVSLAVPVSAAAAREFLLPEYDVDSGEVLCYGKKLPTGGKLEVTANSRLVEDASITTLEKAKIPVTVYCLADSATSLSDKMLQQRKDLLLNLSSQMGKEDTMVLATIDDILTESKPMDSKDARDTAINTIDGQVWYTNLYDGISKALDTLHTSTSYSTNRCLVIISDGHDDGKSIAKDHEVLQKIKEIGIPVYTVILSTTTITEQELTLQKQFAEESLGGFLSFPDQDSVSASAAAQRIWDSIKGAAAIRIKANELNADGTDQQLMIRYDTEDTRYEDTILIRAVDLPAAPTVPTTEETEPPITETIPPDPAGFEFSPKLLLICGIGAALLCIGIAAFFLLRKKPEPTPVAEPAPWPDSNPSNTGDSEGDSLDFKPSYTDPIIDMGGVTMPVENRCHVYAVAIMHPEITCDFHLTPNMETTFGRNSKAEIILNSSDTKLSSCHGSLLWNGKMLLVQDRNSTNGTAVNGQICANNVWLRLEEGSTLTAGAYDYRIRFKVE